MKHHPAQLTIIPKPASNIAFWGGFPYFSTTTWGHSPFPARTGRKIPRSVAPAPDLSYASGRQEGPVHAKTDMDDTFNNPSIYETENGRFGERNLFMVVFVVLFGSCPVLLEQRIAWRLIKVPTSKLVIIMFPPLTIRHAPRYPSLRLHRLVLGD